MAELHQALVEVTSRPVVLIGHSWGAWLCSLVTATYPADVQRLILVSSGPFAQRYVPLIAANRCRRLGQQEGAEYLRLVEQLDHASMGTPADAAALARLGELARTSEGYDPDLPEESLAVDSAQSAIYQGVWPAAAQLRRSGALLNLVARISCPVLAIHGEQDPHPAAGVQEPLAARLSAFRMEVLSCCGHDPWRERQARERFYRLLAEELASCD